MLPTAWKRIAEATSIDAAARELHAEGLGARADELLVDEYVVHVGREDACRMLAETLDALAPLDLSIAPVVAGSATDAHGAAALLTRYRACPGETLIPIDSERPFVPAPEAAALRFREDFYGLLDAGYDLEWALDGFLYLLRGSRTHTIVVNIWDAIEPLDPDDLHERELQLADQVGLLMGR